MHTTDVVVIGGGAIGTSIAWRAAQRGLTVQALKRKEARALEPSLTPQLRAAWFVEGDHQIDNRALTDALHEAAKRAGVEMIGDSVVEVEVSSDRATGVRLEGGSSVACENVVVAAGGWSASIDGIPEEFRPPVRPVKGQLL